MANEEIHVRPATPQEIASFVIPSWVHSYALSYVGKLMRADARHSPGREKYWNTQLAKINRILAERTTSVRVAEYDGEAIGWICDDETARRVHFILTGRNFRRQGVAKALLPKWFDDAKGGPVYLSALPPPWYSRPNGTGAPAPWSAHVCIDLVSPF